MAIPKMHPLAIDSIALLICASFYESYNAEQMAVIGAFFNVIGDLLSLNSSYISYLTQANDNTKEQSDENDGLDLLKDSIEKIKQELDEMKKTAHN